MSSITQALAEKDRALYGKGADFVSGKVVSTGKQQRGGPKLKSGTDLWKLQHIQAYGRATPYLDAQQNAEGRAASRPPAFEEYGAPGWLYNKERKLFFYIESGKTYWVDQRDGRYKEVCEGREHPFTLKAEGHGHAAGGRQGRYAIITDLHEAAAALKLDLDHLDRPAAYFAAFGCDPSFAPAEVAAKSLHSRVLSRLAECRGRWSDEELQTALADSFEQPAQGARPAEAVEASAVLVLGDRLIAATSGSARGFLTAADVGGGQVTFGGSSSSSSRPCARSLSLSGGVDQHLVLSCGALGLGDSEVPGAAAPWLGSGRCRAACMQLLRRASGAHPEGLPGALVAVALRLCWVAAPAERSAKRPRREAGSQVRCRHILVRHAACKQPQDPVRGGRVSRAQEEAEARLLQVLADLGAAAPAADGKGAAALQAAFTAQCRAVSECTSSLKGGELSGDLGWLDPAKQSVKAPAPIAKVAVGLQVGQLSDIVVTELGLHVLLRTA